ncbi:Anti-repressor SinI [Evansella caseinilytica]|uniref:Anti-repressor SinI n=1 Tax=Evansella caseinilytica TaxID=1503961 RepID=A0A1H3KN14_9BACI|nr:anti-repressor SinI family protein [Evansella caseinilytica]SDY53430.1 Anti-repressor SinI [Evansella caseinilytica]
MVDQELLDEEWKELILEALSIGLTPAEIRTFLQENLALNEVAK